MTARSIALPLIAAAAFAVAAGCGGEEESAPGPAEDSVVLAFTSEGLRAQTPLRIESGARVALSIRSLDGRPHGVTVEDAPKRPRVVVLPGKTRTIDLGVLPDGRYRLAPDGAQEPLTLIVG